MALSSPDETDLLVPLFAAAEEDQPFSTFLHRLRRRTDADYVGLLIRQGDGPIQESKEYFAGIDIRARARAEGAEDIYAVEHVRYDRLRLGRVYGAAEFFDFDASYLAHRERTVQQLGIADERVVRITEADGLSAWLVLARSKPCTAADSALLSNLVPFVALALRNMVKVERQKIEMAMNAESLARSGTGWIVFDRQGRVVAIAPATAQAIRALTGASLRIGERLGDFGPTLEREIQSAAEYFAETPDAAPRSLVLTHAPRVELLLLPADPLPLEALARPAMLALCRLPRSRSEHRASRLAGLFDLPPREAELAIALSDGLSLAEAAEAMGLTVETTRNYSKRLFAKLDVRGQTGLVRLVYESSVALT